MAFETTRYNDDQPVPPSVRALDALEQAGWRDVEADRKARLPSDEPDGGEIFVFQGGKVKRLQV